MCILRIRRKKREYKGSYCFNCRQRNAALHSYFLKSSLRYYPCWILGGRVWTGLAFTQRAIVLHFTDSIYSHSSHLKLQNMGILRIHQMIFVLSQRTCSIVLKLTKCSRNFMKITERIFQRDSWLHPKFLSIVSMYIFWKGSTFLRVSIGSSQ